MLVQMAISRTREYAADRMGAEICGNPIWLASALGKIAGGAARVHNPDAERNPATAHMFIINPLSGERMDNLFSTHPNTENRIRALQEMAGSMGGGGGGYSRSSGADYASSAPQARGPAGQGTSRSDPPGPWGRSRRRDEGSTGGSPGGSSGRNGPWG